MDLPDCATTDRSLPLQERHPRLVYPHYWLDHFYERSGPDWRKLVYGDYFPACLTRFASTTARLNPKRDRHGYEHAVGGSVDTTPPSVSVSNAAELWRVCELECECIRQCRRGRCPVFLNGQPLGAEVTTAVRIFGIRCRYQRRLHNHCPCHRCRR